MAGPIQGAKLMVVPQSPEDQAIAGDKVRRYALDSASQKLLKETGRRAAMRLFEMLGDDAKWNEVGPRNQISLIDLALTRAFGRVETVSAEAKLEDDTDKVAGTLPTHLRALASTLQLPELQGAKAAVKQSD